MKALSQFQAEATISTGGAAKFVSVPPIEILTNNTPSVPNSISLEQEWRYTRSLSKKAAKVIAAASVMNEPSMGVMLRVKKYKVGVDFVLKTAWRTLPMACRI